MHDVPSANRLRNIAGCSRQLDIGLVRRAVAGRVIGDRAGRRFSVAVVRPRIRVDGSLRRLGFLESLRRRVAFFPTGP
jgi:hypothetical protein